MTRVAHCGETDTGSSSRATLQTVESQIGVLLALITATMSASAGVSVQAVFSVELTTRPILTGALVNCPGSTVGVMRIFSGSQPRVALTSVTSTTPLTGAATVGAGSSPPRSLGGRLGIRFVIAPDEPQRQPYEGDHGSEDEQTDDASRPPQATVAGSHTYAICASLPKRRRSGRATEPADPRVAPQRRTSCLRKASWSVSVCGYALVECPVASAHPTSTPEYPRHCPHNPALSNFSEKFTSDRRRAAACEDRAVMTTRAVPLPLADPRGCTTRSSAGSIAQPATCRGAATPHRGP